MPDTTPPPSRWDAANQEARDLIAEYDELDLAELFAEARTRLARLRPAPPASDQGETGKRPPVSAALAVRLVIHRPGLADQHAVEFPTGHLLAVDVEQGLIAYRSVEDAVEDVSGAWYEYRAEDQVLPWEAVYSPGTASHYLIGYCNDRSAAQAAAEAWMREQRYDRPSPLSWTHQPLGSDSEFDALYRPAEDRPDGNATIAGLIVRHRKPVDEPAPAAEPEDGPR